MTNKKKKTATVVTRPTKATDLPHLGGPWPQGEPQKLVVTNERIVLTKKNGTLIAFSEDAQQMVPESLADLWLAAGTARLPGEARPTPKAPAPTAKKLVARKVIVDAVINVPGGNARAPVPADFK